MSVVHLPRQPGVADVLVDAAAYLRRNGWHRGYLYDTSTPRRSGRYPACPTGAIHAAVCDGRPKWYLDTMCPAQRELALAARDALNTFLLDDGAAGLRAPLMIWNAHPDRTEAEAVTALTACAAAQRTRPDPPAGDDEEAVSGPGADVIRLDDRRGRGRTGRRVR